MSNGDQATLVASAQTLELEQDVGERGLRPRYQTEIFFESAKHGVGRIFQEAKLKLA